MSLLPRLSDILLSKLPKCGKINYRTNMYSLPPEILILIFQECGTLSQACALARTSIYTHRVWQECRPTLAWQLASQEVIAFDDAVMAVGYI